MTVEIDGVTEWSSATVSIGPNAGIAELLERLAGLRGKGVRRVTVQCPDGMRLSMTFDAPTPEDSARTIQQTVANAAQRRQGGVW